MQLCPKARQAIKALVEDRRYDYIETGSLISIKKNVKDILIPSEERRLNMYPMDYEEFLWAVGDQTTFSLLAKCYESDFAKIDATGRLAMLFDAIPAELNKNAARYQVNSVLGGEKIEKVLELIAELKDSKTVLVSYNVNDPNAGMSNTKDLSRFKLFLCDTGLFVTLMFKDRDFTENEIYEKLRRDLSRYVFAKECAIRIDKQQKERYNNVVIDNGIIIWVQRSDDMANRDHSLDDGIIQAAYSEFLAYGFQKASLHKIAEKAGVTTGAIYTRYKNKDALFASLLQNFFETMRTLFTPIAEEYEKAKCSAQPEDILCAINAEEQVYFRLLTEHRDDCTLFFCRSDGSSMETMLNELMDQKAEQTVEFFSHIYGKAPNADAIRLLMGSQFWYFRQLLDQHMEEGRMLICLQAVLDFTNAGWRQLCDTLQ